MKHRILLISSMAISCSVVHAQHPDLEYTFNKAQEFHYINKDSAYAYYEKTISLSDSQNNLDYLFMGHSYLINANGHYYDLPQHKRNIERLDSIIQYDKRVDNFEWADYYRNYILFDKGNYYYKTKEYTTSKKYFLELYNKIERLTLDGIFLDDVEMLSSINSFLGLINYHTGKYEQAEYTYRRNIELIRKHTDSLDDWQSSIISSKKLLSQVYEVQNRQEEANFLLYEALEYYSPLAKNPSYKNSYLSTLMLLAKNFCKQEDYKKALDLLDKREDLADNPFFREISFIEGDAYLGQNMAAKALEKYEDGLAAYLEYRRNRPHQDIAKSYAKLVEFNIGQAEYNNGIQNLLKAFNASGNNIKISSIQENPKPEEVYSKRQLLHLLHLKLQLLQSIYLQEGIDKYSQTLIKTNQDILITFDVLKKEFESKLDKQFLAETAYPIFHRMLAITFEAYQQHKSPELFELAMNISEKNKDFLLLEALRNANATQYGDVPTSIIEKEARLRAEISNLEKNLFDTSEEETAFSEDLFYLKQEYYGFLDSLKIKYPKYHDLKYQSKALDLSTIRESLENDEVLISFSMAGDYLYALILNDDKQDFLKLPFDESDREAVRDYYKLISSPTINNSNQEISELAANLYEKILKLPLKNFDSENLTIIPDDVLHYLPFDLLVEDKELLLRSKFIGYGNSISSYLELKEKENGVSKKLLAFAPSFDDEIIESEIRFEFGKLLYNDDEVKKIGSVFESEIYSKNDATLERFQTTAPEFDVIHLATHASANDEYPDYSYLAFSKDEGESNILYIKDLYNMVLNSEMITLSACQTGIGKLQKGQGMMSLSKGFFYAGAKSLVTTLWKINDKSSVKLMEYFYEALSKGKNKKEALRDAKLKYLATTDDNLLRHPYYWSAFVVSGDIAPIKKAHGWWYLAAGAAIGVLVIVYLHSQRKRKGA